MRPTAAAEEKEEEEEVEAGASGAEGAARKTALSVSTTRLFRSTVRSRCALGELALLATRITAAPSDSSA